MNNTIWMILHYTCVSLGYRRAFIGWNWRYYWHAARTRVWRPRVILFNSGFRTACRLRIHNHANLTNYIFWTRFLNQFWNSSDKKKIKNEKKNRLHAEDRGIYCSKNYNIKKSFSRMNSMYHIKCHNFILLEEWIIVRSRIFVIQDLSKIFGISKKCTHCNHCMHITGMKSIARVSAVCWSWRAFHFVLEFPVLYLDEMKHIFKIILGVK